MPAGPLCPPGAHGARGPPSWAPCSGDTPVSALHGQMHAVTVSPLWNLVSRKSPSITNSMLTSW